MKLPKSMKRKIKEEQARLFEEMSNPDIAPEVWEEAHKKYAEYSTMLKPSWRITPDTLLVVAGNLGGILLILNFEKLDIVRSKALSFVLKGRV